MEFTNWLNQSWSYLVIVVGAITLLWNFRKLTKEIKEEVNKPIEELKEVVISEQQKNIVVRNALQSMQRRSLLDGITTCIKKGYADMNERETLSRQYQSYTELGGNSFIHEMYQEFIDLPFEKPKSKSKKKNTETLF